MNHPHEPDDPPPVIPRSRFPWRAAVAETVAGLGERPGRSVLTALGTVLGIATLAAVLGVTTTASGQVSERFSVLRATGVTVQATPDTDTTTATAAGTNGMGAFPDDAAATIEHLNGVDHAGLWWQVPNVSSGPDTSLISAWLTPPSDQASLSNAGIYAATPGVFPASHAQLAQGRYFDAYHQRARARVTVLGQALADQLGVTRLRPDTTVFIGGTPFTVIGILDNVDRNTQLLLGATVPSTTATALWGPPGDKSQATMTIDTQIGAARLIGSQAALALRPDNPEAFRVQVPPDPQSLQQNVSGDLATLFLALAGITLIVGAFGIANTTLVSVLERTPQIGLRRALGARPIHIATQFIAESGLLGLLGGLVGSALGVLVILTVAITQNWTAIMPPEVYLTPLLGLAVGVLAGIYPAWRASRIEPVEALRR